MHQHPRPPPGGAPSPARGTHAERTLSPSRTAAIGSNSPSYSASTSQTPPSRPSMAYRRSLEAASIPAETRDRLAASPDRPEVRDSVAKLSQVVQNYFTKAALIVLQSRVSLPPAYAKGTNVRRVNKWFNVDLEETDVLRDSLQIWKTCGVIERRPPPLIIDVFLDTSALTNNQSLVIYDDQGKRWDVDDAMRSYMDQEASMWPTGEQKQPPVILERWTIQLGDATSDLPAELGTILPRVYKNSIVLFRSLYTYAKLLPAWRLGRNTTRSRAGQVLPKLKHWIYAAEPTSLDLSTDGLRVPLPETQRIVTDQYAFDAIDSPAGPFSIKVTYRLNCDFRIESSEAVLSSQFINDDMFRPSLGEPAPLHDYPGIIEHPTRPLEPNSLPQRASRNIDERSAQATAYGSLSTFHTSGSRLSSSPLSALRAARDLQPVSPSTSPPTRASADPRSTQTSRSSVRSSDGPPIPARRTSVSFTPFKSPSLSASPLQSDNLLSASPRGSSARPGTLQTLTEGRRPPSAAQPAPPLHAASHDDNHPHNAAVASTVASESVAPTQVIAPAHSSPASHTVAIPSSASASPRPTPRYSSSFGHRRARLSSGGSKAEDDNESSGKASITSSAAHTGSGVLQEPGGPAAGTSTKTPGGPSGSSGSLQTDDDNISDFLRMLDQKKDLKSFQLPSDASAAEAAARRTSAALSKYHRLRDSNAALSESMSSSLVLNRSSSSSSRQLSSVPPMVAGTSLSTASSPGERISPRTPHTPAIPSRLSANSIVEYGRRSPQRSRPHRYSSASAGRSDEPHLPEEEGELDDESLHRGTRNTTTGAIDIPTSPRPLRPSYRRSSSVRPPLPAVLDDDLAGDVPPYGLRSASLGHAHGDERVPLSLSALVGVPEVGAHTDHLSVEDRRARHDGASTSLHRQRSTSSHDRPGGSTGAVDDDGFTSLRGGNSYSRRGRAVRRGPSSHGSSTSLGGGVGGASGGGVERGGSGSGTSDRRGARLSFPRSGPGAGAHYEDEEPLLFAMSDFGIVRDTPSQSSQTHPHSDSHSLQYNPHAQVSPQPPHSHRFPSRRSIDDDPGLRRISGTGASDGSESIEGPSSLLTSTAASARRNSRRGGADAGGQWS